MLLLGMDITDVIFHIRGDGKRFATDDAGKRLEMCVMLPDMESKGSWMHESLFTKLARQSFPRRVCNSVSLKR
jgi:hypothetical protein